MTPQNHHLNTLHRWLRFRNIVDICTILKNLKYHTVAIYGGGVLGEVLFEYLKTTDIEVKYIIDQNPDLEFPYDIKTVQPEHFFECSTGVDAILLALLDGGAKYSIAEYTDLPIILLGDLLIDIDELRIFFDVEDKIKKCGAVLFLMDLTRPLFEIKNPSDDELAKLHHHYLYADYLDHHATKLLIPYYDEIPSCNEEYARTVYDTIKIIKVIQKQGIYFLQDVETKYANVINGLRFTSDSPAIYDGTIHLFGNCNAVSCFCEDKYTIASQLQSLLNIGKTLHDKVYRVINHANWQDYAGSFKQMLCADFNHDDIVLLLNRKMKRFAYYLNPAITHLYDVCSTFDRPHNMREVFFDTYHLNPRGAKMLAERFYAIIGGDKTGCLDMASETIRNHVDVIRNAIIPLKTIAAENQANQDIDKYTEYLLAEKVLCEGLVGAVVMNANPFTNGHLHLIEQASQNCDFLYIFVVEEDRSFFKFDSRFSMVKSGVANIPNVKIIPSGSLIISSVTLPEYFMKEESPDIKIDASKDLNIFADIIAPALNIAVRFVGEEPFDQVTNQYNQAMKSMLPPKGIAVVEIQRKASSNNVPISASKVRELLHERRFDEIADFVPRTTLEYLKSEYI
jgi:[citrate (pro-3S)-lyase] ligase